MDYTWLFGRSGGGKWILIFFIGFLVFIGIRNIITWYFKLNSIESLLEDIKELLTKNDKDVLK